LTNTRKPKILLIALKFMGDLIVAAPSIHALRRHFPNSHITVLLRKGLEEVFIFDRAVDEVLGFDYLGIRGIGGFRRLGAELAWVMAIRRRQFDIVVSLQPSDRSARWAWLSGARARVGPKKQAFGYLFNMHADVIEGQMDFREYYAQIIGALGVDVQQLSFKYSYPSDADDWAETFLNDSHLDPSKQTIGIHPGSRDPVKLWPSENFLRLADRLSTLPRTQVLFFQGPNDSSTIEELRRVSAHNLVVADCSAHITHLAALLKRCRLYIGNDSGPRHLAAAVGTHTLTLMHKAKLRSWKIYDESEGHFVLTDKTENPDSDRALHEAATINTLSSISVDEVFEKARQILSL
jgi:ADP-heptose:LPS heptosyltransferase